MLLAPTPKDLAPQTMTRYRLFVVHPILLFHKDATPDKLSPLYWNFSALKIKEDWQRWMFSHQTVALVLWRLPNLAKVRLEDKNKSLLHPLQDHQRKLSQRYRLHPFKRMIQTCLHVFLVSTNGLRHWWYMEGIIWCLLIQGLSSSILYDVRALIMWKHVATRWGPMSNQW